MILSEAKISLAKLIDNDTTRGVEIDEANTIDYANKMLLFLDLAQKNIAETKYIRKQFKASQFLPVNPTASQFETTQHKSDDIIFRAATAHAYCFSIDDVAEIYIEGINQDETITILDSIYGYSTEGFNSFKGFIEIPEDSEFKAIQLRFSGNSFYNIKNVALIPVKYSSINRIPNLSRYIKYEMPYDFAKVLAVQIKKQDNYIMLNNFMWDSPTTLAVSVYEQGEIRVEYASKPETINDETSDSYKFEIDESLHGAMLYYAASLLMQHENASLSARFLQMYQEKMINYDNSNKLQQNKVKKVRQW